ncbi:TonB-dependent receptor [Thalassotalea marina]|uniref:Oar protein n=1 Tax=Thalassotalea marina TaxID=1673741 RepID=A0A919BNJ4_9GAMM|nr:carboxypeptidase regulatory-like domain-containing protein [Thalassotalea marina]GHG03862.1 Oar protein [Thalassotalea marina]
MMINLKRSALALAVVMATSTAYAADNSSGGIYGSAKAGATVTVVNQDTGLRRTVTAGEDGKFNLKSLPVGKYKVSSDGNSIDLTVTIGTNQQAFLDSSVERIEVTGGRMTAIDTTSVESTTVFTAEQLETLPVNLDVTSVALLAPGTTQGDSAFGNLASFGGSSVAENGYYINGFDVTDLRKLISFADLPYDAIAQQQVKTGGYGAEFGRSLGGIVNLVTKRGTNEWKFGGAIYTTPGSLKEDQKNVVSRDPELDYAHRYHRFRSYNKSSDTKYNIYGGGPIIEDTLFIFGMVEGQKYEAEAYGRTTSTKEEIDSPQYMVKVDWNITDDHLLEYTHINNESDKDVVDYKNADDVFFVGKHGDVEAEYTEKSGGTVDIVKYTGFLTDDLTVSALYGKLESEDIRNPEALPGAECPRVFDSRFTASAGQVEYQGCWNTAQVTIRDPNFGPNTDERETYRFTLDYVIGDHNIRIGYDKEEYISGSAGTVYTGDAYWRYFNAADLGLDPTPNGYVVRKWDYKTGSASFSAENTAFYIEDTWQVNDNWTVYAGLRRETFENLNGEGNTFVEADELDAPRLGFTWDVDGDSTKKLFGTWGRYYIPVATNTNIRASGTEYRITTYYEYTDIDPVTWAPSGLTQIGEPILSSGSQEAPDSRVISVTDLDPMHQDEFILGYQQEVNEWMLGLRAVYRDVKDGMDDYCSHQPFADWAADNGHTNFDTSTMAGCMMMNPGKDFKIFMDLNNDGNLTENTIPKEYLGLDKYKRTYKALEFFFERPKTDNWFLQGSYTWAKSEGNIEGYVNSTLGQDDAGLTQDLDHAMFQQGSYGSLPNERRHTFKVFGMYDLTDEIALSANLTLQSGRPLSCTGYVPLDDPALGEDAGNLYYYSASSFYCLNENGEHELGKRGDFGHTPWTKRLDMGVMYNPDWADGKVTFRMDLFNVLNFQEVTKFTETGDVNRDAPYRNPEFMNASDFQAPRSIRLSARFKF